MKSIINVTSKQLALSTMYQVILLSKVDVDTVDFIHLCIEEPPWLF